MDVTQIGEVIKLVEESDMSEVIVEQGDQKITLRRQVASAPIAVNSGVGSPPASSEQPSKADTPDSSTPGGHADIVGGNRPASWKSIDSPMVGVFYSSPSPDADSYVEVGSMVAEGDPLCIVEAMKLMNEVSAEYAGVIREICVSNSDLVEYGTPLFFIEPL